MFDSIEKRIFFLLTVVI